MPSRRDLLRRGLKTAGLALRKVPPPTKRDLYVHAGLALLSLGVSMMYLPLGIAVGGAFLAYLGLRK